MPPKETTRLEIGRINRFVTGRRTRWVKCWIQSRWRWLASTSTAIAKLLRVIATFCAGDIALGIGTRFDNVAVRHVRLLAPFFG